MTLFTTSSLVAEDCLQFGEVTVADWVAGADRSDMTLVCAAADWLLFHGPTTPSGASLSMAHAAAIGAVYAYEGRPRLLRRGRRLAPSLHLGLPGPDIDPDRDSRAHDRAQAGLSDAFREFWAPDSPVRAAAHRPAAEPYAVEVPGLFVRTPRSVAHLGASPRVSLDRDLARGLAALDGRDHWHIAVAHLADPADHRTARRGDLYPDHSLQAGGTADAMVLQLGVPDEDDGVLWRNLGRGTGGTGAAVRIEHGPGHTDALPDEVWTAEQAAPVVAHYARHRVAPDGVTGRVVTY